MLTKKENDFCRFMVGNYNEKYCDVTFYKDNVTIAVRRCLVVDDDQSSDYYNLYYQNYSSFDELCRDIRAEFELAGLLNTIQELDEFLNSIEQPLTDHVNGLLKCNLDETFVEKDEAYLIHVTDSGIWMESPSEYHYDKDLDEYVPESKRTSFYKFSWIDSSKEDIEDTILDVLFDFFGHWSEVMFDNSLWDELCNMPAIAGVIADELVPIHW